MKNKEAGRICDVIIVLGGGIDAGGNLSARSLDRIEKAVQLFKDGIAKNIVICGGWPLDLDQKPAVTEAAAMRTHAINFGVPAEKIYIEEESRDTIGNACHAKTKLLRPNKWRSVLIITSTSHCARAKYIFRRILGSEYNISTYAVIESHSVYNYYYEFIAKLMASHVLKGVSNGDDTQALAIVTTDGFTEKYKWHPIKSPFRLLILLGIDIWLPVPGQIS